MLQFEQDQVSKGVGMFGQSNNQDDSAKIPEQSIDAALNDAPEQTTPPTPANDWQHPGKPLDDTSVSTSPASTPTPVVTTPATDTSTAPVSEDADTNDLIDIKQQALSQLAPLVDHLDQTPEERFRTTMMMIQASDNQALIKDAYAAAQDITDEKARAQALLDIINEINYFTQQAA